MFSKSWSKKNCVIIIVFICYSFKSSHRCIFQYECNIVVYRIFVTYFRKQPDYFYLHEHFLTEVSFVAH